MSKEETGFEELLERLKAAVERLETPDIPLEEAMAVYEEGVKALRRCLERLKEAESRVEMLVRDTEGLLKEVPFQPGELPDDERPAADTE